MADDRQMKIGALVDQFGVHPAAWLSPEVPFGSELDLDYFQRIALKAESGKLDFFFMADTVAVRDGDSEALSRHPSHMTHFEPLTLLSALAASTSHIGLAGTASTEYTEPFNVARQFASLDHLSNGRAAWNAVTTAASGAAKNFGKEVQTAHSERYQKANEFLDVVTGLWATWEDDAIVRDHEAGVFFDPNRLHQLNHEGPHYKVRGPLNVSRTPQGQPVTISAGGSIPGRELAARTSEVVFSVVNNLAAAKEFYTDLKGRMVKYDRNPRELKILTSLNAYIGRTEEEAQKKFWALQKNIHPAVGLEILRVDLGIDLRGLDIDKPIPEEMLPETSNATKSYFDMMVKIMREDGLSIRQLYERCAASRGGLNAIVGSAEQIADHMQEWFEAGAADGFMFRVPALPTGLEDFVDYVVPELQRRGLFRKDYSGKTLRDHLGLQIHTGPLSKTPMAVQAAQ